MTKMVLLMVLCSELASHQCKVIPTPQILFDDYEDNWDFGIDHPAHSVH